MRNEHDKLFKKCEECGAALPAISLTICPSCQYKLIDDALAEAGDLWNCFTAKIVKTYSIYRTLLKPVPVEKHLVCIKKTDWTLYTQEAFP